MLAKAKRLTLAPRFRVSVRVEVGGKSHAEQVLA